MQNAKTKQKGQSLRQPFLHSAFRLFQLKSDRQAPWGVHPIYRLKQSTDSEDSAIGLAARHGGIKPPGESHLGSANKMKRKLIALSRQYVTALRKHLRRGQRADLQPALGLGRRAVGLGIETLELARIHEDALVTLEADSAKDGIQKRAEIFFTEAIIPIIETHRAARQSRIQLNRLNEKLGRRTVELAVTHRQLQRGIVRRKSVEAALKISGEHYAKLLKDSLQLQEGLRQLTHQVLAAQEDERRKISRELQDEIAQTLLGINVRLLTLKREARTNTRGLKNEIASTQRLVLKSAKSVRRAAREFGSS